MQFWKFTTTTLATLLAVVSLTSASGPSDGDAVADPNSAVVQLTADNFKSFLDENPLVLTEFFAPWCGYCKMLGPEYAKAADLLNDSHPNIKLAQVDCVDNEALCMEHGIRGYPTLKIIRNGSDSTAEDYEGPREAAGIADFMIKQSLPPVQTFDHEESLLTAIKAETKPFIIQVNPNNKEESLNEIFSQIAGEKRKDYSFISVSESSQIKQLNKVFKNAKLTEKKPAYLVIHPEQFDEVAQLSFKKVNDITVESLTSFVTTEVVPFFGDINRDTYMAYMSSPLPLAYYFYKTPQQRAAVLKDLTKLGKQYRGKVNFVGLDASLFGKHAEMINMDPEIIPLFAIQDGATNKKYGVNQQENPNGPSIKTIEQFVKDFVAGKLEPIVKSEPLPTEEEIAESPVVKLVAYNHNKILDQVDKDIFVKYYAPWCGHCKKLAPTWEELAEIFDSNKPDAKVVIANIDHTNNDVDLPFEIEGYPTLVLFPANGEIDTKTGLRKPIIFQGQRDLDSLLTFVKENGTLKLDGRQLQEDKASDAGIEEDDEEEVPVVAEEEEVVEEAEPVAEDEAEAEADPEVEEEEHDEL